MKRINYGNVAATLALVFAMSGGAVAATGVVSSNAHPARHYIITSNHAVNGSGILAAGPLGWLTLKTTTV